MEEHHIDRNGPTFSNETEKERRERLLKVTSLHLLALELRPPASCLPLLPLPSLSPSSPPLTLSSFSEQEEHHGLDISDGSFEGHFDNLLQLDAFNPLSLSGESWKSLEDKLKETKLGGYNEVYAAARCPLPLPTPLNIALATFRRWWRTRRLGR